jgi:fluoride exporter
MNLFLVMIGGAVGSAMRYLLGRVSLTLLGPGFPYGTLAANLLGGLAMGLLAGGLLRAMPANGEQVRLLLGVGVLGGFTTFSSFSLETVNMLQRGDVATATGYVALSVAGAILAVFTGVALTRVGTA